MAANITVVIKDRQNWIWKQITTTSARSRLCEWLLSKIVRTEFESKSQPARIFCVLSIVVIKDRQNWIWKQITTREGRATDKLRCYQRSSELNLKANHNSGDRLSQKGLVVIKDRQNWIWKQITTVNDRMPWSSQLLSKIVRTEFESKSQLWKPFTAHYSGCYQRSSELNLKANHNLMH